MPFSRRIGALTLSSREPGSNLLESRLGSSSVYSRVVVINSREPTNLQSGVIPG